MVFDPPPQARARVATGDTFVKRALGLPGDVLQGAGGLLLRNGVPVAEPYLPTGTVTGDFGPVRVQPGHVFMLGDNRGDSFDSRFFGQVPARLLVGEVVQLLRPLDGSRSGQQRSNTLQATTGATTRVASGSVPLDAHGPGAAAAQAVASRFRRT